MTRWMAWVLAAGVLAGLAGCGESPAGGADGDGKPVVVATTTMIADLARQIGGDDIEVISIMRTGEDPHVYEARPRDAEHIAEADLVLMNGLHLEATLLAMVDKDARRVAKLAEAEGIRRLASQADAAAPDPHAWMSVPNWKVYAAEARDALAALDPANADEYRSRTDEYLRQLDELDAWVRQQLETVPREQRVVVTSHDAFNYYAQEYGVEVHGVIGISTEQAPRPQDIEALERLVKERGVKALFIETSVTNTLNEMVRKIAEATGAKIGGSLYSDSLGAPETDAGTYIGMMRHNTRTMVEALK